MKGRASRAVYMRLQPSLLSPPSDPEEREKKKREQKKKKKEQKKTAPFLNPHTHTRTPTDMLEYMVYGIRLGAHMHVGCTQT